jgi:hypothetical protein
LLRYFTSDELTTRSIASGVLASIVACLAVQPSDYCVTLARKSSCEDC